MCKLGGRSAVSWVSCQALPDYWESLGLSRPDTVDFGARDGRSWQNQLELFSMHVMSFLLHIVQLTLSDVQ